MSPRRNHSRPEDGTIESRREEFERVLWHVGALPALLAAAVFILAGLFPLRLDLRTFQAQARLEPLGLPRGSDFLALTRDNAIESAELAQFALAHWSFPRGARRWLTLHEASTGVWSGGFLAVAAAGGFHRPEVLARGYGWRPAEQRPDWLAGVVRGAALVYDTADTRRAFEARLPELSGAARVFVAGAARPGTVPLQAPHLVFSPTRALRLAAVLGTLAAAVLLLRRRVGGDPPRRALATASGVTAGLATLLAATYVAGEIRAGLGASVPFALWALGGVAVLRAPPPATKPQAARRSAARASRAAVILAVVLYLVVVVLRLDFDGDTYTTYIPVARYAYLLGHHDPRDAGVAALVQGGVYPPGFPTLLALPLWLTGQPREASFALGPDTAAALLLYRLALAALDVAFLAALGAYLAGSPRGTPHLALAGALAALAVAPVLRGAHTAAETLLVPLAGTAIVALCAGRRWGEPWLAATGLFLGGLLTLVKLDGLPCLVLLVLPVWLATPDARAQDPPFGERRPATLWRREAPLLAALLVGLVPFVVWRLTGPAANQSFTGGSAAEALARLPALGAEAFKLVVKHELWLPLVVLLPAAVAARLLRRRPLVELLPAAGIAVMCALWVGVYAFSALGALGHMAVSLPRILVAPALAALVYAFETCALAADGAAAAPRSEELP